MRIASNTLRRKARFNGAYAAATAGTTQTQAGATLLTGGINFVTTGNASDGVLLPSNYNRGEMVVIVNSSGAALNVYPGTDGKINNGSANAAKALAANMTGLYVSLGSNSWGAVLSA
ncbi:MAG: hypothetical protein WAT23_20145 [Chromatiaceae bacterium]